MKEKKEKKSERKSSKATSRQKEAKANHLKSTISIGSLDSNMKLLLKENGFYSHLIESTQGIKKFENVAREKIGLKLRNEPDLANILHGKLSSESLTLDMPLETFFKNIMSNAVQDESLGLNLSNATFLHQQTLKKICGNAKAIAGNNFKRVLGILVARKLEVDPQRIIRKEVYSYAGSLVCFCVF